MKKEIKQKYIEKCINKERRHETELTLAHAGNKRIALSSEETACVKKTWGEVADPDISEWEIYKYLYGFDERFLGHNIYLPLISRRLNDYHYTDFFGNKCLMDIIKSGASFPKAILRCIDGEFYDGEMHQMGSNDIISFLDNIDFPIIIKPSVESGDGRGVIKINPQTNKKWAAEILKIYSNDFVIQEWIDQDKFIASFNHSSVNTFRITSLYLNGEFSICNIMFRYGNKGKVVDNANCGGNILGVYEDGQLHDCGLDNKLNRIYECNGIKFREVYFDFIPDLLEKVKEWHTNSFSLCKFIGWDIAIDKDKQYVVLEVNTSQPGIFVEQLAKGEPIFKDRTAEVIEYVTHKEFQYGRSIFRY